MNFEQIFKWLAIIAALSGWFKVLVDHLSNKPKLSGRILTVMKGTVDLPNGETHTSYMVYPYILNKRKNSVHVLDYEFFVKLSRYGRWQKLNRVYGMENQKNLGFKAKGGEDIGFKDPEKTFIYKKNEPVQHGVPLHGWVPFFGPKENFQINSYRYKIVCIDAYGGRHKIVSREKNPPNPFLLMEIAGIVLPVEMLPSKKLVK